MRGRVLGHQRRPGPGAPPGLRSGSPGPLGKTMGQFMGVKICCLPNPLLTLDASPRGFHVHRPAQLYYQPQARKSMPSFMLEHHVISHRREAELGQSAGISAAPASLLPRPGHSARRQPEATVSPMPWARVPPGSMQRPQGQ